MFADQKVLDIKSANEKLFFTLSDDLNIVDCQNPYAHQLPDGRQHIGLMHFYKAKGQWHFVPAGEKAVLPHVCFATYAPLKNVDLDKLPDLS